MSGRQPAFVRYVRPDRELRLHRLGALLARWHSWRRAYNTERSYARQGGPSDPEDELELMLMNTVEYNVSRLPLDAQRVLQQIARAECMGVETVPAHERTTAGLALSWLEVGLIKAGVL
jgi:hypothetical protein